MSDLPASIRPGARLDVVATAVAAASATVRQIYVERRGTLYRWSPATRGGAYPLLRITAKLLSADHHRLVLPFRSLHDSGLCIIPADEPEPTEPSASTVLDFESAQSIEVVRERIHLALNASPAEEWSWENDGRAEIIFVRRPPKT